MSLKNFILTLIQIFFFTQFVLGGVVAVVSVIGIAIGTFPGFGAMSLVASLFSMFVDVLVIAGARSWKD